METTVSSNPLLATDRPHKLMLGVFGFNGSGSAFTYHPGQRRRSWQDNVAVAQRADALGLEALVSFARWLPLGADDSGTGRTLDPISWAAALGAVTERIAVIATIHSFAMGPAAVAKAIATIDQITDGRAGLNVVVGWNEAEAALLGNGLHEHDDRYVFSQEWLDVLERLWTSPERFDYNGTYLKVEGAISNPRPVHGRPVIMNAGSSDRGRNFAAANADMAFVMVSDSDAATVKAQVESYRELARESYGREIQVWTHSYVVQRDSVAEASAFVDEYAVAQGDLPAADEFLAGVLGLDLATLPRPQLDAMRRGVNAGAFGVPLLGTADDIAGRLQELSDAGVDGVLMTWLDYNHGLDEFAQSVLPVLVDRGLRSS